MSLSDLKKSKATKIKSKNFTVDEFISDAENYAKGQAKIVSAEQLTVEQAVIVAKQRAANKDWPKKKAKTTKPKRHATFTLSEESIAQLQLLSKETHLSKSHIIRILINELGSSDQKEKLSKLLKSTID
jgi:hypothetical protein